MIYNKYKKRRGVKMIDFDKAIKAIDEKIIELEKEKEDIKNFNNYDLIKKLEILKKTELRYQREEIAKNLVKSFKSEIIREHSTAKMKVNYFVIDIDGFKIFIPMYLSKIIYVGYMLKELKKEPLYHAKSTSNELADLIKERAFIEFFHFKKKRILDSKIEFLENKFEYETKRNVMIALRNSEKDEKIKNNKKILLAIKEDIELLKTNGYDIKYTIDSIYNHSLI